MRNSECEMRNEGREKEISSMKFLWLLSLQRKWQKKPQMFIENRIKKRNETDSCILRKTCYWDILVKGFSVQKKWEKNNFVNSDSKMSGRTNQWINKTKRSFNLQPNKTIICEAQAIKKLKIPKRRINS